MKDKVSIIVPIYNVEKYLVRCIESCLNQTYQAVEIVLVNDGSFDNSGKIAEEYAQKHKNIILIHKENGGLSDARNVGILKSSGEFIACVDSDDFIKEDMISDMMEQLHKTNADIVVCDMEYLYDSGEVKHASGGDFDTTNVNDSPELIRINNSACNKIIRKSLFDDVLFPKGKVYEDLATIPILLYKAKRVTKVNKAYYVYYQRSGSIAHSANKKIFDIYDAIDTCLNYIKNHGDESLLMNEIMHMYVIHGLDCTTIRIKDFKEKELREEYLIENMNRLNKAYPTWKKDKLFKNMSIKKKIIFLLLGKLKVKMVLKIYDK